jgi:hypothetical protein
MARINNGKQISEELATLQRIEELLMVITRILVSEKLAEVMKDPKQRVIYEGAGRIPVKELAKKVRVSFTTISGLWQKWEREGLMLRDGKSYRPIL